MAKIHRLNQMSVVALCKRKRAIIKGLRPSPDILRASCVEQFLTCGKSGCSCRGGQKHGPYLYLTTCLAPGKIRKFLLKTAEQKNQARAGVMAYLRFMECIEELSQINSELLRRGPTR